MSPRTGSELHHLRPIGPIHPSIDDLDGGTETGMASPLRAGSATLRTGTQPRQAMRQRRVAKAGNLLKEDGQHHTVTVLSERVQIIISAADESQAGSTSISCPQPIGR